MKLAHTGAQLQESSFAGEGILPYHIPQAFSHFTYVSSARRKLVCDLQGVWNQFDGYVLTDPVKTRSNRDNAHNKSCLGPAKPHSCSLETIDSISTVDVCCFCR